MRPNKEIVKELSDLAPVLSSLDRVELYRVDEAYFENSADNIVAIAGKQDVFTLLEPLGKRELYQAPPAVYFENMADKVMAGIHAEEVAEELSYAAPHLQHLSKKQAFNLPTGYFSSFPEVMVQMAAHETAAHSSDVEELGSKWSELLERAWSFISRPSYALVVAGFIGSIICIGLLINDNSLSNEDEIVAQMQQIPASDLHRYMGKHRDEFDERTILHHINDIDLNHYFDKPEDAPKLEAPNKAVQADDANIEDIID